MRGTTIATLVLAAAMGYGSYRAYQPSSVDEDCCRSDICCFCYEGWPELPNACFNQHDDDHCYREQYRAQLEAWEARKSYDEIRTVSPTGVAFVRATPVRRPPGGIVY
jgi:hypothetical protein